MQDQNWGGQFAELRGHLERAVDGCGDLADALGDRAVPALATLRDELARAQELVGQLRERLHNEPLDLLRAGRPLPREAFYLLVAIGVLSGGTCSGDAYEDFQMLRYEDDERRCYIDLGESPAPGVVRVHLGAWPEQLDWDRLRPDQQEFFDRYLPEVVRRFRGAPGGTAPAV